MKPVCLLFSHLNLQVLWFSLDFCHYFIGLNMVFLLHHSNLKKNKNNEIQAIWVGKYNHYLPFGVVFLPFSISLWAVSNLADVCFEGWKPIADMTRTEGGASEMNDTLKPIEPVDISRSQWQRVFFIFFWIYVPLSKCELIWKSNQCLEEFTDQCLRDLWFPSTPVGCEHWAFK